MLSEIFLIMKHYSKGGINSDFELFRNWNISTFAECGQGSIRRNGQPGCLAGSVRRVCDSGSQSHEFEPTLGMEPTWYNNTKIEIKKINV